MSCHNAGVDVKKNVIVTVSSDKGLCGGINSTSVKISKALHKLNSGISSEQLNIFLLVCFSDSWRPIGCFL